MVRRTTTFDAVNLIQIVVAVFLVTLGVIGIMAWNSNLSQFGRGLNRLFGRPNDPFNLIAAIVQLAAGVIVFAGVFANVRSRLLYWATMVIAILWAVEIFIGFFVQGIFQPEFVIWLNRLAADLIILLALWLINRRYA